MPPRSNKKLKQAPPSSPYSLVDNPAPCDEAAEGVRGNPSVNLSYVIADCGVDHQKVLELDRRNAFSQVWQAFSSEIEEDNFALMTLLFLQRLESTSGHHFLSVVDNAEKIELFFELIVDGLLKPDIPLWKYSTMLRIISYSLHHLENVVLRTCILRYVSLPIWTALSPTRVLVEIERSEKLRSSWSKLQSLKARNSSQDNSSSKRVEKRKRDGLEKSDRSMLRDEQFIPSLLVKFFVLLPSCAADKVAEGVCRTILQIFILLMSRPTTRKFFSVLVNDHHFPVLARLRVKDLGLGGTFDSWLDVLQSFCAFDQFYESNDSRDVVLELQRVSFSHFPEKLKDLVYSAHGSIVDAKYLLSVLELLDSVDSILLAKKMHLWTENDDVSHAGDARLAHALVVDYVCSKPNVFDEFAREKLYPTEATLFDGNVIPASHYSSRDLNYPLPKLDLQYLNLVDYLHRCYQLYHLESSYEIRDDVVDAIFAVQPKQAVTGRVGFSGKFKMATPIITTNIEKVTKPKIGEMYPSRVTSSIEIDLSAFSGDVRQEWEELRESDVIERPRNDATSGSVSKADVLASLTQFVVDFGVKSVRGAEVIEMRDEAGTLLNSSVGFEERQKPRVGTKRRIRLDLDPRQYFEDNASGNNCYETFNLLIRRNGRENTFKSVLNTIRSLGKKKDLSRFLPTFMHDVLLGTNNPLSASYFWDMLSSELISTKDVTLDFCDTFQDIAHVRESFPEVEVVSPSEDLPPPYTLSIGLSTASMSTGDVVNARNPSSKSKKKSKAVASTGVMEIDGTATASETSAPLSKSVDRVLPTVVRVEVSPSLRLRHSPYGSSQLRNTVRYTPRQIEAIRTGMHEGMSLIIGPPGSGKTDVAVQLIANLYHQHPMQKILVVTHSNAALNDIFAKIMGQQDIDPRHLLRLGSGERDLRDNLLEKNQQQRQEVLQKQLELENTFSKTGRVNWSLTRRLHLLGEVQRLAASMGQIGDFGQSCEIAEYFFLSQIKPRIDLYRKKQSSVTGTDSSGAPAVAFPFTAFFADLTPETLAGDEVCATALRHVEHIFSELREYRAYELLRTQTLRADYLLTKQARIVAMTCKHAAIMRDRLVEQGFRYDSLIVEEAAQILEVETLIPMLLQDVDPISGCRLKRIVLLGDHQQLPPIVRHPLLRQHCNLDQSMFLRFLKLGVPATLLDAQGRSRPQLAALFAWKYAQLGNLPLVQRADSVYARANAGFVHTHQFIDVGDFEGKGEMPGMGASFQNLGEAEYVVATYQYMRLLGYPAEKISILTTYSAQRQLIRDLLLKRCQNAVFGMPSTVATVDRFQGQQNDYVLVSLVRTRSVGHVQDVRRLIVAVSRARLGLYLFGRRSIFEQDSGSNKDLAPVMRLFFQAQRPARLQLLAGEAYPTERAADDTDVQQWPGRVLEVEDVTAIGILVYQMVQQQQARSATATAI